MTSPPNFCTKLYTVNQIKHLSLFLSLHHQAGCMYIHGGVVNIHENKRTGSLFKIWLAVPSLLELCWEKLLKAFPQLTSLPTMQLLNLGLTQELIERLK